MTIHFKKQHTPSFIFDTKKKICQHQRQRPERLSETFFVYSVVITFALEIDDYFTFSLSTTTEHERYVAFHTLARYCQFIRRLLATSPREKSLS
jgi:hypothetical protein